LMATYIDSDELREAFTRLQNAGASRNLFAYLILRRLMVKNAEPDGTIKLAGSQCKPVIDEAALVGGGDDRYCNPIDSSSTFLSNRWWSNGPTDNIKNWGSRSTLLERVQGTEVVTIRVAPYDKSAVTRFLQIKDRNRIDRFDIAIWWLRAEDIDGLTKQGVLSTGNVFKEFKVRLGLTDQECNDLFAPVDSNAATREIGTANYVANPRDYLPYPDGEEDRPVAKTINEPHNLIYFGAPGTGKSYQLQELAKESFPEGNIRRVTFHPDYTYAQFVGCFKPFIEPEIDEESPTSAIRFAPGRIEYKFVPGPFIDTYVDAIRHPGENYLLVIEEINRANPAAVFGDVFQLLDRREDGTSEYSVVTSEDLRWYMFKQWKSHLNGVKPEERNAILYSLEDPEAEKLASSISLPPNMYIWATMNSADQGVFPMDTAFKRRWDFRYMGINDGSSKLDGIAVPVGKPARMVSWDALRRGINKVLLDAGVNEDKLLGPFFITPSRLRDKAHFTQTFMDKVLLYLFEDAAKTKKSKVFSIEGNPTYSDICNDFKARGELAFRGMIGLAPDDSGQSEEAAEPDSVDGEA